MIVSMGKNNYFYNDFSINLKIINFLTFSEKTACDLYESFVSSHYAGSSGGQVYSSCYTTWGHPSNLIKSTSTVTYSTIYHATDYGIHLAIDGYSCKKCKYFSTKHSTDSYVQVDFGTKMKLRKVIVATIYPSYFKDVKVYLGNATSYLTNQLWAEYLEPVFHYSEVTIMGDESFSGRYLTLLQSYNENFGFCEIQAIPKYG